ncbi:hypothetical protein CYMTET_31704 [Cymbomonas tetramitiformis]|uniref:Uncharacterized protein n=1 Tax=Cymbomonas tetramitiformis TaxID=36881 RepID=A0AAE0KSL8_9CHLO|nr:hypothetical protein CYMTET_31704 [Cymbomonas tetramitiformis]
MVLMKTSDWVEEDHGAPPQSLSAAMSTTTANHQQVPPAELQRLTSKAFEEMSPGMTDWFRRTAVCYTLCNEDPKKTHLTYIKSYAINTRALGRAQQTKVAC